VSVLTPAYRLRVYAPRSTDATELTVLTPAAGAPHAEAFRVATIAGVAGYRPYLFPPTGRRGRFDPLTKRVDVGEMTFAVFDKRTPTGTNAQRWVTAFAGDAEGRPLLLNCRAEADESLDGGATWTRFFTGRIQGVSFGDVLVGTLAVREESERFDEELFVGRPHSSIAYARTQAVLPVQPPPAPGQAYRRLAGTVDHDTTALFWIDYAASATKLLGNVVSEGLTALAARSWEHGYSSALGATKGWFGRFGTWEYPGGVLTVVGSRLRALVTWSGGSGEYPVTQVWAGRDDDGAYYRPFRLLLGTYAVGAAGYAARPADGLAVQVTLVVDAPASATGPIVIEHVNPLTLWQDVHAGKFAQLNLDGSVRRADPVDAAAFTALAAARTFLPVHAVIEKPIAKREFLERYILRPYHLGYRTAPDGSIVPFDCRRDSTLASAGGLGTADLARPSDGFSWEQQRGDAISNVRVEAFRDRVATTEDLIQEGERPILRTPAGTIESFPLTVIDVDLTPRALDVTGREYVLEAPGWRSREDGTGKNVAGGAGASAATLKQEEAIIAAAVALAAQLRSLFGAGSTAVTRAFRRATAGGVYPGMWRRLTVPEAPNAASYVRGGERLGLCVDRIEDGPLVTLSFLDGGSSSIAVVPVLASLAISAAGAPTVTVTRNAAGDPVLVEVALTAQSVGTLPTTGWLDAGVAKVDGAFTLPTPPAGLRLWVRGRSEPQTAGDDYRLPSAYVSPTPAFIDTGTVTAPTGVSVSAIQKSAATVSWTNGDATAPIEILLVLGSFSAGIFDAAGLVVATLPAGSTSFRLTGLDGPSVAHCVGVRHFVAETGRFSVVASANFTTGTTDVTLGRPAGLAIAAPLA
jgi:hypothetical protein